MAGGPAVLPQELLKGERLISLESRGYSPFRGSALQRKQGTTGHISTDSGLVEKETLVQPNFGTLMAALLYLSSKCSLSSCCLYLAKTTFLLGFMVRVRVPSSGERGPGRMTKLLMFSRAGLLDVTFLISVLSTSYFSESLSDPAQPLSQICLRNQLKLTLAFSYLLTELARGR